MPDELTLEDEQEVYCVGLMLELEEGIHEFLANMKLDTLPLPKNVFS